MLGDLGECVREISGLPSVKYCQYTRGEPGCCCASGLGGVAIGGGTRSRKKEREGVKGVPKIDGVP